jgi:hypothetical protein
MIDRPAAARTSTSVDAVIWAWSRAHTGARHQAGRGWLPNTADLNDLDRFRARLSETRMVSCLRLETWPPRRREPGRGC